MNSYNGYYTVLYGPPSLYSSLSNPPVWYTYLQLWPLFGGRLTKPHRSKLFYVPQRPYMTLGTLRDQVIYPDTMEDQRRKGISDDAIADYLDKVGVAIKLLAVNL